MTEQSQDLPPVESDEARSAAAHVATAYSKLDALRGLAERRLVDAEGGPSGGTHQARSERDAQALHYRRRAADLDGIGDGLTFGHITTNTTQAVEDPTGTGSLWIGRIGLLNDDHTVFQVDWRTPAAAPFYQATHAHRCGVTARTHITTRDRKVVQLLRDVLDLDAVDGEQDQAGTDSALMVALNSARTGRMGDIVATIQSEQDRIIRSDTTGALVVAGGPGTGKTAVALHRAAYLLYTHRDRLADSGVLVLGPNSTWCRYIEQVLPSLGETSVVALTLGSLFPGVEAISHDEPDVATVKGDLAMIRVLAAAVKNLPRLDRAPVRIRLSDIEVILTDQDLKRSADFARGQFDTYNAQRVPFLTSIIDRTVTKVARARRLNGGDSDVRDGLAEELRESLDVRRELNLLWLPTTPVAVLARLFSDDVLLAKAAHGVLSAQQQQALHRDPTSPVTVADIPLLDELAELLGPDPHHSRVSLRERAVREATARALADESTSDSEGFDDGGLDAYAGIVSADDVANRYAADRAVGTLVERATADREWTYGHAVVDEAQELSAMAWRVVARRVPSRSMTIVGDLAQASSPGAATSWANALDDVTRGKWVLETLTVNYRTPRRLLIPANEVLLARGLAEGAPSAVREGDSDPSWHLVDEGEDIIARAAKVVVEARDASALSASGTWAVLTPAGAVSRLRAALHSAGVTTATGAGAMDASVAVLDAAAAKGLEFDHVIVVDPAAIEASSTAGAADLYVALTRATQTLHLVVHSSFSGPLRTAYLGG